MSKRYLFLLGLLLFRFILGWWEVSQYRQGRELSVTGNIIKTNQTDTKCILLMGRFLIEQEGVCATSKGTRIKASGIVEKRLIDSFLGRLWLVSAEIDYLEKNSKTQKSENSKQDWLDNFRESLVLIYKKYVPEPEAGLVAGIVLGYKKDIGQDLYQQMVHSGSIHIAVASGYNVLLVGGVVMSLCFWLWKRRVATWIALGVMILYAFLAGGEPPVIRAVWMAGFIYIAQLMGRASLSSWILALTATVMLVWEPPLLTDVSFQLSVVASLGMIVLEPWLTRKLELPNWGGVMTTVATMITTAPVLWFWFGRMSLIGIVSNILILPLVPPLMMVGSVMLVLPPLFVGPVYVLAHFLVVIIGFFGK